MAEMKRGEWTVCTMERRRKPKRKEKKEDKRRKARNVDSLHTSLLCVCGGVWALERRGRLSLKAFRSSFFLSLIVTREKTRNVYRPRKKKKRSHRVLGYNVVASKYDEPIRDKDRYKRVVKGDETASSDGRVKDEDIILSTFLREKERRTGGKKGRRNNGNGDNREIASRSRSDRDDDYELFSLRRPRCFFSMEKTQERKKEWETDQEGDTEREMKKRTEWWLLE